MTREEKYLQADEELRKIFKGDNDGMFIACMTIIHAQLEANNIPIQFAIDILGNRTPERWQSFFERRKDCRQVIEQLTNHQRQLDFDGSEVGVSRQALSQLLVAIKEEQP